MAASTTSSALSLFNLWLKASNSFHWKNITINSHAITLFIVYVFWHLNWNLPRIEEEKAKALSRRASSSSLEVVSVTTRSSRKSTPPPPPTSSATTSISSREILDALPTPAVSISSDEDSTDYSSDSDQSLLSPEDDEVAEACPEATPAERNRFLTARSHHVPSTIKALQYYVDWHLQHEDIAKEHNIQRDNTGNDDLDIWNEACAIAMKACGDEGEPNLPQVIRTYRVEGKNGGSATDLEGHRIFHIMPAQMDDKLAKSATYALATALFLDKHLDRNEAERIMVCMDVRAGKGWPNIHAMRQVPFMKSTTMLLLSLFPERLHKCLVYPVPSTFLWIWNVVSKIVDPLTREKICLLAGPNRIISPPPLDGMIPHMGQEIAELLENARISSFKE